MWQSLKEYVVAVVRLWWFVVAGIASIVGIIVNFVQGTVIPSWVWAAIGLLALLIAQFVAFHRVRVDRDQLQGQLNNVDASGPKQPDAILYINILDYQFGSPATSGYPPAKDDTVWLRVHLHFNAPKPMLVESVELEIRGKRIPSFNWKSHTIAGFTAQYFYFEIPDWVNPGEHIVQFIASANREEWCSDETRINFPQQ